MYFRVTILLFFYSLGLFNFPSLHAQSADEIIEQAIAQKAQNQLPDTTIAYQAYTKTVLRFPEYFPVDTLLGRTIMPFLNRKKPAAERKMNRRPSWLPPELDSEILFLSENLSEVVTHPPKKIKEQILHSRVSGELTRFSFMGSLVTRYDPYDNRYVMPGVTARSLISPLADKAAYHYQYALITQDSTAYEIAIQPKRKYEPCFQGSVTLDRKTLAVKAVDLFITRDRQLDFLDTLWIRQQYALWEGNWVPVLSEFDAVFSLNLIWIKVPFVGKSVSAISSYEALAKPGLDFFDGEILRVNAHTSQAGNAQLATNRPIPLTALEAKDYRLKDSLHAHRNSNRYLDSLTRSRRKVTIPNIVLLGQKFRHYRKNLEINIEHLLSSMGFNPMEGLFIRPNIGVQWDLPNDKKLNFMTTLRYGTANKRFGFVLGASYQTRPKFNESVRMEGGDYISEFSPFSQVGFFPNTQATLLNKLNNMRLYRKRFFEFGYQREVANGLQVGFDLRFEHRNEMPNLSDYSWSKVQAPYTSNFALPTHKSLTAEIKLRYQPFNTYASTPTSKYNLGSAWPVFELKFAKSFGKIATGASDFSQISLSMEKKSTFGFLGSTEWRLTAGTFLKKEQVYFPDYVHFKGNQTTSRPNEFDAFFLIDYYEFSTTLPYIETHIEHEFSGLIFNKIPFIRKLKIREYVGLHSLIRQQRRGYLELNVGLEKLLLKLLSVRVDLYFSLSNYYQRPLSVKYLPPGSLINFTK